MSNENFFNDTPGRPYDLKRKTLYTLVSTPKSKDESLFNLFMNSDIKTKQNSKEK